MICRVCEASGVVTKLGDFQAYVDYVIPVFECARCGCRFTESDESVFERLHKDRTSAYSQHRIHAERATALFRDKNVAGLKKYLRAVTSFRYVMEVLDREPKATNLLEIGCSQGQLTSYFIVQGRRVLGTDISPNAVESARSRFGDHFALTDSPSVRQRAPYDAIYHTGTIGCVTAPVRMTKHLLSLLKPGGILAFNVPNIQAARDMETLWIAGARPPDLVTLFPKTFWGQFFSEVADVSVTTESADGYETLLALTRRLRKVRNGGSLFGRRTEARDRIPFRVRSGLRFLLSRVFRPPLFPRYAARYGMNVLMRKK